MSKLMEFLSANKPFYLATVDGDQPKLRPLGAVLEMDGKVIFGVGDFKDVYKQLAANPKCEICTDNGEGLWLRYTGTAVFATDYAYAEAMLESAPHLRNIYNDETGHKMMCFWLEDAEARLIQVMGEGEKIDC
ncbi:MAG: pyridoxamine 5'-phosphate oxidase family protein [Eggerthellaceae bacterium]